MRDILQQQAALRENSRRLSQTFEKALASPLLTPARLRLASSASTVGPEEEEEVVFVEAKNKRKASSPLDPEKFKKDQNMEAKMDQILANMATSKDMAKIASRIEGKISKLEDNQVVFNKNQKDILSRLEVLEKDRTKATTRANKTDQRLKRLTDEGIAHSKSEAANSDEKAYELARKQLVLTPVSPDMETVLAFLCLLYTSPSPRD